MILKDFYKLVVLRSSDSQDRFSVSTGLHLKNGDGLSVTQVSPIGATFKPSGHGSGHTVGPHYTLTEIMGREPVPLEGTCHVHLPAGLPGSW